MLKVLIAAIIMSLLTTFSLANEADGSIIVVKGTFQKSTGGSFEIDDKFVFEGGQVRLYTEGKHDGEGPLNGTKVIPYIGKALCYGRQVGTYPYQVHFTPSLTRNIFTFQASADYSHTYACRGKRTWGRNRLKSDYKIDLSTKCKFTLNYFQSYTGDSRLDGVNDAFSVAGDCRVTGPLAKLDAPVAQNNSRNGNAQSSGSSCSDVSGGSSPQVKCEKAAVPKFPIATPPSGTASTVAEATAPNPPKTVPNMNPTDRAANALSDVGVVIPEQRQQEIAAPLPMKESPSPAVPSQRKELLQSAAKQSVDRAAGDQHLIAARRAMDTPTCNSFITATSHFRFAALRYRNAEEPQKAAEADRKAALLEDGLEEIFKTNLCSRSTRQIVKAKRPGLPNLKSDTPMPVLECKAKLAQLQEHENKGGEVGPARVLLAALQCRDQSHKPSLRECLQAEILWQDAGRSDKQVHDLSFRSGCKVRD